MLLEANEHPCVTMLCTNCLPTGVIAEPEVAHYERCSNDDYLLLASDGLWNVLSNKVRPQANVPFDFLHQTCGPDSLVKLGSRSASFWGVQVA